MSPEVMAMNDKSCMSVHIPHEDATLIARAAVATKQSISEFIVAAAIERAKRVLRQK
jgi:uncharacterized protein (DUF1778 family)